MAKITKDGMTIEGSVEELREMGIDFNEEEAEVEAPKLKVGDYAKVIRGNNVFTKPGDIVKVIEDDQTFAPYKMENIDGSYAGWKKAENVVLATDEEVAKVKRQSKQAAHAKLFTDAGREVDEYREGDIVEVAYGLYAKYPVGTVREVEKVDEDNDVWLDELCYGTDHVNPVVYVENRLDKREVRK